jgi:hypothetical protein
MFARIAHLTICQLLCSHRKQHKFDNTHRRGGAKDGKSHGKDSAGTNELSVTITFAVQLARGCLWDRTIQERNDQAP